MDAQAIIEMNKARVKMGMKPLPVPGETAAEETTPTEEEDVGSTLETREAAAYDNWQKMEDERNAKKRREEKAIAIKKAREMAQRNVILEGRGLGDFDEAEDQSAKSWIKGSDKRQKKISKQRQLQLEADAAEAAAAAAAQHQASDLAGVTIGHDQEDFFDGNEHVLTLKDSGVLENEDEGDELEAFALRENEKLKERLDLKKKRPVYNPNDFDEDGEHSILAQYDEEISGKKRKTFKLSTATSQADDLADILQAPVQKRKFQTADLGILDDAPTPTSDYLAASEIKVKSKKKKAKSTRKRVADDEDALFAADAPPVDTEMDLDPGSVVYTKKKKVIDDSFVDDDDLQATLAQQRRDALKKRKKVRPEDIAKQLREQDSQSPEPENGGNQGLLIDEISHFVDRLQKSTEEDDGPRRPKTKTGTPVTTKQEGSEDEDEAMEDVAEAQPESAEPEDDTGIGADEKIVGGGMAEALQLLKERGLVSEQNASGINDGYRQKQRFIAELHRRMSDFDEDARTQRERDRASGRLDRMSIKEREDWQRNQNTQRDMHQARMIDQLYRQGYKPNVELKYIDEYGRRLDQKEAFKELSHGFHGKKSGKGKTEKLLKKIDDEKRRNAQSVLDASQNVGMSSAATLQGRKRREAGIRLA